MGQCISGPHHPKAPTKGWPPHSEPMEVESAKHTETPSTANSGHDIPESLASNSMEPSHMNSFNSAQSISGISVNADGFRVSELVTFLHRTELRHQLPTRFDSVCRILNATFQTPLSGICLVCRHPETNQLRVFKIAGTERECSYIEYEQSIVESIFLGNLRECSYVEDALEHPVYRNHPYVTGFFKLRFIAGAPLWASDGSYIGAAVVADMKPRKFTEAEAQLLTNLSTVVLRDLEHFYLMTKPQFEGVEGHELDLESMTATFEDGILLVDQNWQNIYGNTTWEKMSGFNKPETEGKSFWDFFEEEEGLTAVDLGYIKHSMPTFQLTGFLNKKNGLKIPVTATFVSIEKDVKREESNLVQRDTDTLRRAFAELEEDGDEEKARSAASNSTWTVTIALTNVTKQPVVEVDLQRAGLKIEDVTLKHKIGQGGFGVVFEGDWQGQRVAVKFCERINERKMSPLAEDAMQVDQEGDSVASNSQAGAGFKDPFLEALLSLSLKHPNLVRSYKYLMTKDGKDVMWAIEGLALGKKFHEPGEVSRMIKSGIEGTRDASVLPTHIWLVQEYCDYGTLDQAAMEGTFLPEKSSKERSMCLTLSTLWDIAQGLKHLHARDLIHGDLTGNNVLLKSLEKPFNGKHFVAKISDFGLAKHKDRTINQHSAILTSTFGTVLYMPPELICQCTLSTKTDSYSLGALMYMMASGQRPFQGLREPQILSRFLLSAPGRMMFKFPVTCDPEYVDLARDCSQHDYKLRLDAEQILERIQALWTKYGFRDSIGPLQEFQGTEA